MNRIDDFANLTPEAQEEIRKFQQEGGRIQYGIHDGSRKTISDWQRDINALAHEKGWYESGPRNFGEVLMLMVSELSEALEEWRRGKPNLYFEEGKAKPEGIGVELADAVIRIFDTAWEEGIDLEKMIRLKHEYNKTRSYRHEGKKC